MGVDFLVCPLCKETYPDCGDVRICTGCEKWFCGYCNPKAEIGETCPICRYDVISAEQLLEWVIANHPIRGRKELEDACRADLRGHEVK